MIFWTPFRTLAVGETFRLDPTKATYFRKVSDGPVYGTAGRDDGALKRFLPEQPVLVLTNTDGQRVNL